MKTLLLALVVVAFMCLGSADQLGLGSQRIDWEQGQAIGPPHGLCVQCDRKTCKNCFKSERCQPYNRICYTLYKPDENGEMKWAVKGCAKTCPSAKPGERVKCCSSPRCNEV
uniref:Toxin 3FTx-Tel4 n=1 Tax=Telescopus dhara TaxID=338837 RepID=3NB4_TELDH|nr:RecName: Full=Toxin 3FTx-Tel4; Flags: Precursor [Telescopus dhara]ABU68486.1 3FTx-Tel4 [Telescopus dhara]